MVEFSLDGSTIRFEVQGLHRLWAFKSRLEVPLAHIRGVTSDPNVARGWWKGLRMPGTNIPNIIVAGTFYMNMKRTFWDVSNAAKAIVIYLEGNRYDRLVIEVQDPEAAVGQIVEWVEKWAEQRR